MATMTEWLELLMGMSNLGYILLHNTCEDIVFSNMHNDHTLRFKNWREVAAYISLYK